MTSSHVPSWQVRRGGLPGSEAGRSVGGRGSVATGLVEDGPADGVEAPSVVTTTDHSLPDYVVHKALRPCSALVVTYCSSAKAQPPSPRPHPPAPSIPLPALPPQAGFQLAAPRHPAQIVKPRRSRHSAPSASAARRTCTSSWGLGGLRAWRCGIGGASCGGWAGRRWSDAIRPRAPSLWAARCVYL